MSNIIYYINSTKNVANFLFLNIDIVKICLITEMVRFERKPK